MNTNEEDDIDNEDFYELSNNKINSLETNLNALSELNPQYSTIKNTTTFKMSSEKTLKEMLNDIKIPYPNNEEIPLIKIKDEDHYNDGQDIENYIKSLIIFEDNKFNICSICKKGENKYFCKNCNKNICDICYEKCLFIKHTLNDLNELLDEAKENIKNINIIISKNYILPKEKESSEGIEKKNKNYEIMNEFEINNEIGKLKEYTNDIIFIEAIIDKNYINYFHYINIKVCLFYLKKNMIILLLIIIELYMVQKLKYLEKIL